METDIAMPKMTIASQGTSRYTQENIDNRLAALADRQDEESIAEIEFLSKLKQA